jgi:hypothetical protein
MRIMLNLRWLRVVPFVALSAFFVGCSDSNPNDKPAAPATTPEQQAAERAAREKAFGKATIPGKASAAPKDDTKKVDAK